VTATQRILARDGYRCAYCGGRAIHADHIVPVALRRRHRGYAGAEFLVAACGDCNWRKGTRRLAPASFAARLGELPGSGWRVWDGSVEMLREVVRSDGR
jgi:5-methylcytosine-specific restriction endonuclease McrA